MKKFEGILLASDLDGTLLCDDKSISEENIKAIEYFKSEGGTFIFITGRLPVNAKVVADAVKPNGPCGCLNGGGIYDYEKGEYLWNTAISRESFAYIDYVYKNYPEIGIEFNCFDNVYFIRKNPSVMNHIRNEKLPDLSADYTNFNKPVAKLLFGGKFEVIRKIMDEVKELPGADNYDIIRSDEEYYEIMPKGIHKGVIIRELRKLLPQIKIFVAVGDNDNDEEMLLAADYSIAVSNAKEKTKKAADIITVSNNESAIAKIIYTLL